MSKQELNTAQEPHGPPLHIRLIDKKINFSLLELTIFKLFLLFLKI